MNHLFTMLNTIRDYAWGHEFWIKDLLGNEPDIPRLQAELWIGAHPSAPSKIDIDGRTERLDELIASDPESWLGSGKYGRGGATLPFLAKILAAAKPLSIQAHPSLSAATAGFADEDRRGIPRNAEQRNYKDANHKPEIICALNNFRALCGFRPASEVAADFRLIAEANPESHAVSALCRKLAGIAASADWKALTTGILNIGHTSVVNDIVRLCSGFSGHRFVALTDAATHFPGDPGLLFFIALEIFDLKPGQALFAPAGVLHAYVYGLGVEVMANSDNVLRGGLTNKHIDIPELVKNLDPFASVGMVATEIENGFAVYQTPASEFRLAKAQSGSVSRQFSLDLSGSTELYICTEGSASVTLDRSESATLTKGHSLFVRPGGTRIEINLTGTVFRVSVPNI